MPMSVSASSGAGGKIGIASTTKFVTGMNAKPRTAPKQHVDRIREPCRRHRQPADLGAPRARITVVEERERDGEEHPNGKAQRA